MFHTTLVVIDRDWRVPKSLKHPLWYFQPVLSEYIFQISSPDRVPHVSGAKHSAQNWKKLQSFLDHNLHFPKMPAWFFPPLLCCHWLKQKGGRRQTLDPLGPGRWSKHFASWPFNKEVSVAKHKGQELMWLGVSEPCCMLLPLLTFVLTT